MTTQVKHLKDTLTDGSIPPSPWQVVVVQNDDNLTYLVAQNETREAIWVDPMKNDWETLLAESKKLAGYRFVAVIDTHTHADHISCAGALAEELKAPLIMSEFAPTRWTSLKVARDTALSTAAGPLHLLVTPGHTRDSITPVWGPFILAGDTILYGDTGRDDLPTGDPEAHYESLQKLKSVAKATDFMLTGHDREGRTSQWATQLKINAPLSQDRETFVKETGSWVGPPPKLLKESLFANFK